MTDKDEAYPVVYSTGEPYPVVYPSGRYFQPINTRVRVVQEVLPQYH